MFRGGGWGVEDQCEELNIHTKRKDRVGKQSSGMCACECVD